jgi:hypothetical protein
MGERSATHHFWGRGGLMGEAALARPTLAQVRSFARGRDRCERRGYAGGTMGVARRRERLRGSWG